MKINNKKLKNKMKKKTLNLNNYIKQANLMY